LQRSQELVARVFIDDYLPELAQRTPLTSSGGFVHPRIRGSRIDVSRAPPTRI
jgi:hypothetical protein